MNQPIDPRLPLGDLLQLSRFNTPTVYNGWEQISRRDASRECFNLEETRDFMPHMGPMIGYAITVAFEPSNPHHPRDNPRGGNDYREYVASVPGPKIVIVQDLDKPRTLGSFWGEVNSTFHRSVGCVGTITDGAVRDLDEMNAAGFKALARRLCVGHAYSFPVRWNCDVDVFGCRISPGQLIHADNHGFLAVPREDEARLLHAARFMDQNECSTVIPAAKGNAGVTTSQFLDGFEAAASRFTEATVGQFRKKGEW